MNGKRTMKTVTVNKNSQVGRFVTRVCVFFDWDKPKDICSFTRVFLMGGFLYALFAFLLGVLAIGAAQLWVSPIWGVPDDKTLAFLFFLIGCVGHSFAAIVGLGFWFEARKQKKLAAGPREEPSEPSVVSEMYRSVRDKTCVRVEYR